MYTMLNDTKNIFLSIINNISEEYKYKELLLVHMQNISPE